MAPETILQAITTGAMRVHAEDVPDDVKRAMAEYLSGRKLSPLGAGDARNMPNQCRVQQDPAYVAQARMGDPSAGPRWNGWSPDATNARFQRAPGIAESVEWAKALVALDTLVVDPEVVADTAGILFKQREDVAALTHELAVELLKPAEPVESA